MELLIDADLICYKVGFVTETATEEQTRQAVDDYIGNLTDYFITYLSRDKYNHSVNLILSGKESFRKEIDPEYKANRKNKPKPKHFELIRQHMIDKHAATVSKNGYEGDDVLGFLQRTGSDYPSDTVIVSIDKDLRMIPGYHYHMDDRTLTYVLPYEGMRAFYTQMLTGDATDNVSGIEGVGPVNAKKLLKDCITEQQMFEVVQGQYRQQARANIQNYAPLEHPPAKEFVDREGDVRLLKNSKLLWIRQAKVKNPIAERLETN